LFGEEKKEGKTGGEKGAWECSSKALKKRRQGARNQKKIELGGKNERGGYT